MDQANPTIDRLTQLIEQQARQIEQLVNRNTENPNHDRDRSSERFRRLNPPTFIEAKDPIEAENWLRTMERMFTYAHVEETEKVICASFMLRGSAGHWWDTLVSMGETVDLTWGKFCEIFRTKYFSTTVRNQKLNEFIQLRQGSMTVTEYIMKFEELSRFATHMVDKNGNKVDRFLEGLRPELNRDVLMSGVQNLNFPEVADKALMAEQAELRIFKARETRYQNKNNGQNKNRFQPGQRWKKEGRANNNKRKWQGKPQGEKQDKLKGPRPNVREAGSHSGIKNVPSCPKCGKNHAGECLAGQRVCFRCKKPGHIAPECPAKTRGNPGTARAFALVRPEAGTSNGVVSGTIYIHSRPIYALFDSGTTHSFISINVLKTLNLTTKTLPEDIEVLVPTGPNSCVTKCIPKVPIRIKEQVLPVDLLVLDFRDFDVILGMDWLSLYQVNINCKFKTLEMPCIGTVEFPKLEKTSKIVISFLKAQRLLKRGSEGFWVSLHQIQTKEKSELALNSIPVVEEFPDVFPEELPGLPPDREIEFGIEIVEGTAPISKTPYRMAPTELRELKNQLDEIGRAHV